MVRNHPHKQHRVYNIYKAFPVCEKMNIEMCNQEDLPSFFEIPREQYSSTVTFLSLSKRQISKINLHFLSFVFE